jgi:penicillin-binding protein 2
MARGVHIKDHWSEQRLFDQRAIVAGALIILLTLGLLGRLFLLQVIRHDYYAELSQGNRVRTEPIPAARGLILDRHGEVVAGNQPAYQLELVPEEVPNLQAALDGLVQLDLIRAEDVDELKKTIRSRRAFDSVPVRLRMSDEDVARFAVRRFEFQGLDIKTRQTRSYPNGDLGVHALGYVGAISEADLAHIDRAAYSGTALIGKQGVESAYETKLHGINGSREILVNAASPRPNTTYLRMTSTRRCSTARCAVSIPRGRRSNRSSRSPASPITWSIPTRPVSAPVSFIYPAAPICIAKAKAATTAG